MKKNDGKIRCRFSLESIELGLFLNHMDGLLMENPIQMDDN